jgi:hypothetical protein
MNVRLKLLLGLCAVLALSVWSTSAVADPTVGPQICPGAETAIAGTYGNLTIAGNQYVASDTTLTVLGDLSIAPGACLDAFTMGTVHVFRNLKVGPGAILALGCTINSIGPVGSPCTGTTNDTVGGSLVASQPLTMYLDGDTIYGNVNSTGGGPGPTFNPYVNFPIKDNVIHGSVHVLGWQGAWFGFIRNITYGSVLISHNVGVAIGDSGLPDSNEVASNTIFGNLACFGNTPGAQIGDSGGSANAVGGLELGECAGL